MVSGSLSLCKMRAKLASGIARELAPTPESSKTLCTKMKVTRDGGILECVRWSSTVSTKMPLDLSDAPRHLSLTTFRHALPWNRIISLQPEEASTRVSTQKVLFYLAHAYCQRNVFQWLPPANHF